MRSVPFLANVQGDFAEFLKKFSFETLVESPPAHLCWIGTEGSGKSFLGG